MGVVLEYPGEKMDEDVSMQVSDPDDSNLTWKILVVDDEEDIHRLTRMVLKDYLFEGRELEVYAAYTGDEALKIMSDIPDIALVMLDVVMETDDAGLRVVRHIREEMKNDIVQIVLRTGQPGLAPPQKVITEYEINSYNSKVELTSNKIFTIVTASIRAYKLASSLKSANKKLKEELAQRKKLETQFLQAQKMEAVGRLAGGIAHDFNNMLTVIRGHCELLFVKLNKRNPFFEKVGQIDKAAERAEILTKQLLSFSRHRVSKPVQISLSSIVEGMKEMIDRLVAENVRLILRLSGVSDIIKVDPIQIEQVIMNLVVNARDAMPQGGELVVEVRDSIPGDSEQGHGGKVYLIVSDTGLGMDEDVLESIFEPFFTTKEKGKGTGLGLSTVYGIVKRNKGSIVVDSKLGRGSVFTISFPQATIENRGDVQVRPEVPDSLFGSETILVVEDQADVLEMTSESLRLYGYRVIEAQNAGSALLLYEKFVEDIDLVLTDIKMDLMDGTQLAKRIETLYPHPRIIFMSGYTEKIIGPPDLFEVGKNYVQKPFSITELLRTIRGALDTSK